MKAGDFSRVERDVLAQVEAGAHMLDVNAGIPLADEPAILAQDHPARPGADRPAAVDRLVDRRGARGRARGLPGQAAASTRSPARRSASSASCRSSRKYGAAVVAISNDDTGISEDPDVRFAVAKRIVERAADHGIPRSDIVVDPLVMPIGAMAQAGRQVFALVRRLREELKVNTTCGASNVSFGLPNREGINARLPADGDRRRA